MQQNKEKKTKDLKLIAILLVIIVGFLVLSIVIPQTNETKIVELPDTFDSKVNKLIISEVMSNNDGVFANEKGEVCDYLELYNGTSKTVNLKGYGLSDKKDTIKWIFSDVTIEPNAYLVVGLTGRLESGNNACFKLNAKGNENIILTNPNAKIIDAVNTVSMDKNQVMIRDDYGNWGLSDIATPGFSNSKEGQKEYWDFLFTSEENGLVISEILPRNKGNFINEYGRLDGFVEIYNNSGKSINLSEYNLSNDINVPFKKQLDDMVIEPNGYYVIYSGNKDEKNYLGFEIDRKEGSLILSHQGKIIQNISYSNLVNGQSLTHGVDDNMYKSALVSCGYTNDEKGIEDFQKKYCNANEGLVINEAMNNNYSYLVQNSNTYYDWIELYNNSNQTIYLGDYYLSVDDKQLSGYKLPDVELKANQYIVLMCSGNENLTNDSYYHTNFKLSDNEGIFLSRNNMIVDCMFISNVETGYSYGRAIDYGFNYMIPSPNEKNNSGYRSISSTPEFLTLSGIYNDVDFVDVEIIGNGTIYYTLDGTSPTVNSLIYENPIRLTKTTVVKTMCYQEGMKKSLTNYASYIINENHTMPVMSLSISPNDLQYIYDNLWNYIEKPCCAEFFEDDGSFKITCSLALFGGNARTMQKRSYSLRFKKEYGAGHLEYKVFDNRDNSSYDALVLRSGSTESDKSIIKDIVSSSVVDEYSSLDTQAYKPCILYINGEYHGIYNIREKINQSFIENHYNVDASDADLFSIDGEVKIGSKAKYNEIVNFCNSHDLNDETNFKQFCQMVEIENFIDEWICETYYTNNDVYNIRYFFDDDIDEGRMHSILFDLDYGWNFPNENYYVSHLTNPEGIGININFNNDILKACFKSDLFKEIWLGRLAYLLTNCLNQNSIGNRIDEIVEYYSSEIVRDREHFGYSVDDWKSYVQKLKDYAIKRDETILKQTKSFFSLSDEEMKEYFGDLW